MPPIALATLMWINDLTLRNRLMGKGVQDISANNLSIKSAI